MLPVDHDYLKYYQIKQGDLLLDVGASEGEFADSILETLRAKNAKIICSEPALWCLERLAAFINTRGHGYAMMYSGAVGAKNGFVDLNVSSSHLTSYIDGVPNDQIAKWGNQRIRIDPVVSISLDSMVDQFGPIDFVKMDVESAEVPILEAFTKWGQVKSFAIASYHEYGDKKTWQILKPLLESKGYKVIHECVPWKTFPAMDLIYASI